MKPPDWSVVNNQICPFEMFNFGQWNEFIIDVRNTNFMIIPTQKIYCPVSECFIKSTSGMRKLLTTVDDKYLFIFRCLFRQSSAKCSETTCEVSHNFLRYAKNKKRLSKKAASLFYCGIGIWSIKLKRQFCIGLESVF